MNNHEVRFVSFFTIGEPIRRLVPDRLTNGDKEFLVRRLPSVLGIHRLNNLLLSSRFSFRRLCEWADLIFFGHPDYLDLVSSRRINDLPPIIYDCMDNHVSMTKRPKKKQDTAKNERILCNKSEFVICSSTALLNRLVGEYDLDITKAVLIENGFSQRTIDSLSLSSSDPESGILMRMRGERLPIVTYVGTISEWFDFDALRNLLLTSRYSVYIVGPWKRRVKNFRDELIALGARITGSVDHKTALKIMESSHVLIMPFLRNETTEYVDPVKLYEYLCFHKPIVTSFWPGLLRFREFVRFYSKSGDSFVEQVDASLHEEMDHSGISEMLLESSWEKKLELLDHALHRTESLADKRSNKKC